MTFKSKFEADAEAAKVQQDLNPMLQFCCSMYENRKWVVKIYSRFGVPNPRRVNERKEVFI